MLFTYDKSRQTEFNVMLIEIPDPEVIFSVIVAFLIGLLVLFSYTKLKPYVKLKKKDIDPSNLERLEFYERQLIDMKIRLDALDVATMSTKFEEVPEKVEVQEPLPERSYEPKLVKQRVKVQEVKNEQRSPNLGYNDIINHVLNLITDKPMTSRDIQITIDRTREHTSRLMNKLYKDGFVNRHTESKPFSYSISEKGKERLGVFQPTPTTV